MEMSDSPMFSSAGTGPPGSELFGVMSGASSRLGGSMQQSQGSSLMRMSSDASQGPGSSVGRDESFYTAVEYDGDSATQVSQASSVDPNGRELVDAQETPPAWGYLVSLDPSLPTIALNKNDANSRQSGYLFGRHRDCDFVFTNPVVSSRHCLIYMVHECIDPIAKRNIIRVFVEDMSTNGTFIDSVRMEPKSRKEIRHGAQLQLARWHSGMNTERFNDSFYRFVAVGPSGPYSSVFSYDYTLCGALGNGANAVVHKAIQRDTGIEVAVKMIDEKRLQEGRASVDQLDREIRIMKMLRHPCIMNILDTYNESHRYVVMELGRGGDLFDLIASRKRLTEKEARVVFFQLLHAIKYLHSHNVVHRDLKPENIMLVEPNSLRIKLTDFGMANFIGEDNFLHTLCGSPSYVAPEILTKRRERNYTKKVDIWSCGVLLYVCLAGFQPFYSDNPGKESFNDKIRSADYTFNYSVWQSVSTQATDMIEWMLTPDPNQRPMIDDLLQHPWMHNLDLSVGGLSDDFLLELEHLMHNQMELEREPTMEMDEDEAEL